MTQNVLLVTGPEIAAYGFPDSHPFGTDRHDVFLGALTRSDAWAGVKQVAPRRATRAELEMFHTSAYIDRVAALSAEGTGWLDQGDTPAFPGVFDAASAVVGGTLEALQAIIEGEITRAFIPIGGLHHARRDGAAGFCVFNDCGVAIEAARRVYGITRVAYVDIDAHHGDGVFYGFEHDPDLAFADIHEDGRFLYPGTGAREETGRGPAAGTKLNIPLPPGADDADFYAVWNEVEDYLEQRRPELILLQCGADSLAGDPITHLRFSAEAHAHAAARLRQIAEHYSAGRLLAMGGGGYDRSNLAIAWTRVVEELVRT
jgi:acetoin utilization protein AcuC